MLSDIQAIMFEACVFWEMHALEYSRHYGLGMCALEAYAAATVGVAATRVGGVAAGERGVVTVSKSGLVLR